MGEDETKIVDGQEQEKNLEFSGEEKVLDSLPLEEFESPSKPPPTTIKKAAECEDGKSIGKPKDRDVTLAQVEMEKRLALIKAWEDNEKTKVDNKAYKKLSAIDAWENTKRASVEAQLRQIEEKIERKKAEYGEKTKNKMALLHKAAEEKRALVEADRGKDILTVEDEASKFRSTGTIPKKLFACFSC